MRLRVSLALTALAVLVAGNASAQLYSKTDAKGEMQIPGPSEIQALAVQPTSLSLIGSDDSKQLILTGTLAGKQLQDLSGNVEYKVANSAIVRVTSSGRVIPLANGSTTITATYGKNSANVPVTVEKMDVNLPINFANDVVPIFTKLGCNSGGCHGKSGGQNGFALSLLGFVPEVDYQSLVKENRGRRLLTTSPDYSLLLRKAVGAMAHGGGKRLERDSDEYKVIRRWIAAGTPYGRPEDPVVTKITIEPEHRIVARNNRQQFAVYAHYSDGTVADVTRRAQYESNDQDIAVVDDAALVRSLEMSGEAAIMARYQGQVAVFRATVPLGVKIPEYKFEYKTVVDRHTHKQWQELGIVPSDLAADDVFVRRVYLGITGTLPTLEQYRDFLADNDASKRDKLIDELLETQEYAYYFANRWADVLRVRRGTANNNNRAFGTFAFHSWIRESVAQDKPYDQFVREILGAIGDESKFPPTLWYSDISTPEKFVDDVAQVFLGVRMACAQCHHHPYEKWSQDDYWGLAAFYGRVGRKNVPILGQVQNNNQGARVAIFNKTTGTVINQRTNKAADIKPPDGKVLDVEPGDDPRHKLVDWMVDAKNPFFARSVVNRYWAHFFGRGIVDPLDDMRVTNPPSNPELLDALAKDFVDNGYSLKHLIKTICKSRTFQLSAVPNEFNKQDKRAFARFYPRRMQAEVLFDAVSQVTRSPAAFPGLPQDRFSPNRALMLPDESFKSYFLDVFGRPQRISACECERVTEANLAQALHLLNSQEVQSKLTTAGGRADLLAKDARPDAEKIEEVFIWAFARRPTQAQIDLALENIQLNAANKRLAYENIIWALVNTKEFILIQ